MLVALALASGCIPLAVPIPWPENTPRVSHAQVSSLQLAFTNREAVVGAFGNPDLRRDHDRLWIYSSYKNHGRWVGIVVVPNGIAPLWFPAHEDRLVLVLEFDDAGVLIRASSAERGQGANPWTELTPTPMDIEHMEPEPFCTVAKICISGWNTNKEVLGDAFTAVFRIVDQPELSPPVDACRLILVTGGERRGRPAPEHFRIDDVWADAVPLRKGTTAVLDLVPGFHRIRVPESNRPPEDPREMHEAAVACAAGQTVAVEISYVYNIWGVSKTILAEPMNESEIAAALAKPRLILPDTSGEVATENGSGADYDTKE